MKKFKYIRYIALLGMVTLGATACSKFLDKPLENEQIAEETDYTRSEDMIQLLYGAYAELNNLQWETFPLISVRGDDVNAAGDQVPLIETDQYRYDRNFWIYNSTWLNLYTDLIYWQGAIEELGKYEAAGAPSATAQQYMAEIKVMQGFEMLQLARLWGAILIPRSSQPADLYNVELSSHDEVMAHISNLMDEAIPVLPNVRPNQRNDIRGGITRFTALAVKAMANLELKNYQGVADATGAIISSGLFSLENDYYNLFKIPGKLNSEHLLELQYSDFGTGSGTSNRYLWDFFGPTSWTPARAGAGGGWGFWEPTEKYVKFMLDRGEQKRLMTTVIFTPDGINQIKSDPNYANLPAFVTNVTQDGDVYNNSARYKFQSGKFYLPSTQLTQGRFTFGENKNLPVIRYAEILLMHAEALVNGGTSAAKSALDAVNEVRSRAGLGAVGSVDLDVVLDEKYAEFATEWGIRFFDLVRHNRTSELNENGRSFNPESHRFIPYPLEQQGILPQLKD
jgi:hypothetical protein